MAFDPNDPADKKILADAIAAEVAKANTTAEERERGLAAKRDELLNEVRELKKGRTLTPEQQASLENERDKALEAVTKLEVSAKEAAKGMAKAQKELDEEKGFTAKLLVDNGLTEALTKVNVAPQFMPAVRTMLAAQVAVVADGAERKAMAGDKPLDTFVSTWAASDEGKHFVVAPSNKGGGARGSTTPPAGTKSVTTEAFGGMRAVERAAFMAEGGVIAD